MSNPELPIDIQREDALNKSFLDMVKKAAVEIASPENAKQFRIMENDLKQLTTIDGIQSYLKTQYHQRLSGQDINDIRKLAARVVNSAKKF